jgi:hypothetical protein
MAETDEIVQTLERVQREFENLSVRGLRSVGPEHLATLSAAREEFERIGAGHLASRIAAVIDGIRDNDCGAAVALLRAQASLRVFERILTLEMAAGTLSRLVKPADAGAEEP